MNKILVVLFFTCYLLTSMGQDKLRIDAALEGKTGPEIFVLFPLADDTILKQNRYPLLYPLLIVNDTIIREIEIVNCFRKNIDKTKIRKINRITKAKAERMGISNVPKDGVLFVTTKKGYSISSNSIIEKTDSCNLKKSTTIEEKPSAALD